MHINENCSIGRETKCSIVRNCIIKIINPAKFYILKVKSPQGNINKTAKVKAQEIKDVSVGQ